MKKCISLAQHGKPFISEMHSARTKLKEAFDKFEKLNNPKGQSYVLVVLAELAQSTLRFLPTTSSSNLPLSKEYIYLANNLLENGKSDDTFCIAQNFERNWNP